MSWLSRAEAVRVLEAIAKPPGWVGVALQHTDEAGGGALIELDDPGYHRCFVPWTEVQEDPLGRRFIANAQRLTIGELTTKNYVTHWCLFDSAVNGDLRRADALTNGPMQLFADEIFAFPLGELRLYTE